MPQFDLANANVSSSGFTKIKNRIGFVPFVYDTGYPNLGSYIDNDPIPSGSSIYAESVGGRVPFDPDFHNGVRGNLVVGYGHTYRNEGAQWRGSDALFYDFYSVKENANDSNSTSFTINSVDYAFPIQKGDVFATTDDGGKYLDASNTVITKGIRIKYIGDDTSTTNQRFSESIASTLLSEDLIGYKNKVISVFTGYEDSFPYDNTLAQEHFDMMVGLCFAIGKSAFENTFFVNRYKLVDGTSVTQTSHLTAYNDAGYALMFLGGKAKPSDYPNGDASSANNLILEHYEPILVNGVKLTWENVFLWDPALIKQRQGDIDELLGSNSSVNPTATPLNPVTNSQWYQGPPIPEDFFMARPNAPAWSDVVTSTLPSGSVSNTILELLTQGREDEIPLYYTGDASIYDTDPGNENYWEEDPFYQKAYSAFWQINNRWYKGNQTFIAPRAKSTNGPAIAAQGDGSVPPYIFGLNNGSGELGVYITSTRAESTIDGITGIDSTIWDIADGVKLGDVSNGQWVHRAITRKGNKFTTWENGTLVSQWTSDKTIKRVTRDAKSSGSDEKASMNLSIGRSQHADYFKGYIDSLKVTKGEALYDANFTPSTSAPTIDNTSNSYTGLHNVESVYNALKKIMSQMDTEYKVTNEGKIDAGPRENLFVGHGTNDPLAIIVRDSSGEDPGIIGLNPDALTTQFEAEDWVSGVEYLKNVGSDGQNIDLVERFLTDVPYYDLFGNPLERVAYVNEQDTNALMAPKRAEAYLDEFTRVKKSLSLSLEYYDIKGDFEVGDNIFVYDPEVGFVDDLTKAIADGRSEPYEAIWQGQYINPEKIRIIGISYPIEDSFGVYLRKVTSTSPYQVRYIDLSDYVIFETGNTSLDVGDLGKQIGDDLRFSNQLSGTTTGRTEYKPGKVLDPDDVDSEGIRTTSSFYTDAVGTQQSIIFIEWRTPRNTSGTVIENGLHYEISVEPVNPDLGDATKYFVQWGNETFTVEGLQKATDYKVGVQAVTTGAASGYVYETITTAVDSAQPNKPAQATTMATIQGAVQVIHHLGRATDDAGNPVASVVNFTLPSDLSYLNVYGSTTSGFTVGESTKLGNIPCDASFLRLSIPAVATLKGDSLDSAQTMFFRFTAVDNAGNESDPSDEQQGNAALVATENIDDAAITSAKIQNLSVGTAKIADAAISNVKIANLIESDNYATGTSGWSIQKSNATYPDGFIEINDALIRGNITATTGNIGGWSIASNKLTAGNLELDAGNTTIKGNYSAGSSGFSLNNDGSVEFNSGTFRSDVVGGTLTIGASDKYDNTTDTDIFVVDENGNLYLGHHTLGNAPFSVTNSGDLVATSVTITGGELHIG